MRRKNKGSITVFLSLIIILVVVLIGGLVDGARMRTADAQVNRAVQNGMQSALASYNRELKDRYELFAYDGDTSKLNEEIKDIAIKNLIPDKPEGEFLDLYDYNLDDLNVNLKGPLSQPEVLEEQILQSMKYRAPVNMMEGLIEKLNAFKEIGKFNKVLKSKEELDKKMREIEKDYKDINEIGEEINKIIVEIKENKNKDKFDKLRKECKNFKEKSEALKIKIQEIKPFYDEYKKQIESIQGSKDEKTGLDSNSMKQSFMNDVETYDKIFGEDDITGENLKIIEEDLKILDYIEKNDSNPKEKEKALDEEWKKEKEPEKPVQGPEESEEAYKIRLEAYEKDKESYDKKKKEYEEKKSELAKIKETIDKKYSEIKELKKSTIIDPKDIEADKKENGEKLKDKDKEGKDAKEDDVKEGKSIKNMDELPSNLGSTEDYIEQFQKISGNKDSLFEKVFNNLDFLETLETGLENIRDDLYINEYVITKMKDRAVGEDETVKKFRIPKMVENEKSALDYEVEYILSGKESDGKNGSSVWRKIYAIRILANTISITTMKDCRDTIDEMAIATATTAAFFGVPVNINFLKGIYKAAWVAYESKCDMDLLLKGHRIPLIKTDYKNQWISKNVIEADTDIFKLLDQEINPLSTVYSDYLRLFLLVQGKEKTLGRITDIIQLNMKEVNKGFDIRKEKTQINVEGSADIKYIFFNLPIMNDKRKKGRYEIKIKKSIAF